MKTVVQVGRSLRLSRVLAFGVSGLAGFRFLVITALCTLVPTTFSFRASAADPSDVFFAQSTIHVFKIELNATAAESLRNNSRQDVVANVLADGQIYQDVAIHIKGGPGSLRKFDDKPALTLKFEKPAFHGMRKIHLNNSVQDRSYCNEFLANELFRAADVPAPRVAFAQLEITIQNEAKANLRGDGFLNVQNKGLYVLKEGFSKDFLARYFQNVHGNLYERGPAGQRNRDVNMPMPRTSGEGPDDWSDLDAVAAAAREPDLALRWEKLQRVLDMDRVLSFIAMEMIACHSDGYSLRANNFRVYHDLDTGKVLFFPHGMDQMFARTALPPEPPMGGIVARAILETPEGRRAYRARFQELFYEFFDVQFLTNNVNYIGELLRPALQAQNANLAASFDGVLAQKRNELVQRGAWLERYLSLSEPKPPRFTNDVAPLTGWFAFDENFGSLLVQTKDKDGREILSISRERPGVASWRTRLVLTPGHYRFEGMVQTEGLFVTAERNPNQGVWLRFNENRSAVSRRITGDAPWQTLQCEFDVPSASEAELVCELRARRGKAVFAADTLRLLKLK